MFILQLIRHCSFQKHEFFIQFLSAITNKNLCQSWWYGLSNIAQVIKKYIYLSGAKSNDPLHIVYVPNVFKFTKISAKGTQESLKWYEQSQKRQRRPNVTSKVFTAPCISKNSRMTSLHNFHFFIIFSEITFLSYSVLLFF